ncbi:MAG TPA: SH3 domain-containing protein [Kofleriaceae bacterium]
MAGFEERGKTAGGTAGAAAGGAGPDAGAGKQPRVAMPPMPAQMKVTASALNVRSAPSREPHNIVGGLQHGQVIEARTHDDPWFKVAFQGRDAFVHGDFVKPVQPAGDPPHAEVKAHPPASSGDSSATASEIPTKPVAAPKVAPVAPVAPVATPAVAHAAHDPNQMYQHIYTAGSGEHTQQVAAFVSPGVTAAPNVFVFLHGYDAQLKIDDDDEHKGKSGVLSGIDVAAETSKVAKNTITLVPQGVIGRGGDRKTHEGGYMKAIATGGLDAFIHSLLPQIAGDIGQATLTPAHIGLAGHSAGGYKGMQESLSTAGGLSDTISDVTLMDSDYKQDHFESAAKWLLKKPAAAATATTKTLRISESEYQMKQAKANGITGAIQTFGEAAFKPRAEKAGFSFVQLAAGNDQGAHNTAIAHYQLHLDGKVHADVLLMRSDRGPTGHHQVRDDILDDSILSVGQGAAASDTFGDKVIAGHGDKSLEGLHGGGAAKAKPQQPPVKPVTQADLHGELAKSKAAQAPVTEQAAQAPHAGKVDPAHELPTDEHHGLAGPKVAAGIVEDNKTTKPAAPPVKTTAGAGSYLLDTNDATSGMSAKTKELYDHAMATLRAGNLIFPTESEVPPKTSAPFKKFVASLYGQFGMKEKRINLDIVDHGGASTFSMKAFVESTLATLPTEAVAPGRGQQRMHHKMLDAFLEMREAAAQDGVDLLAISCFRPGKANATSTNRFAVATNSSHGYGLAVDLQLSVDASRTTDGKKFGVSETNTHSAENLMKYYRSSVMKWMAMNGMKFDFHPYYNEPWHFEYNPDGMASEMIAGAKAWKAAHKANA